MLKIKKTSMLLMVFTLIFCLLAVGTVSAADAPSANFTSNVTNGTGPLSVQFNDTSTGSPTSWIWDFGDNNTSTEQNPTHTYNNEGSYSVSLTAFNADGNTTTTQNNYINVAIPPTVTNSLTGGTYNTTQTVTLTTDDATATIYFANDTTDPRNSTTRTQYTGPIIINTTTTLRYAAIDTNGNWSPLYLENYVIGTGGLADTDKSTFQVNNNNTGQSEYTGAQTNNVLWSYTTPGVINYATPVIGADGTIYIGSATGLFAINPDGTQKWNYTINQIKGTPSIGTDGTIYIGSANGIFYAFNPDGTVKWNYTTGGAIQCSPAIGDDGTIYTGSGDGKLYAFNQNGTLKWSYTTLGGIIYCKPAIGTDGTIYICGGGYLSAVNVDGTLKWTYGLPTCSYVSIGVNGTLYVATSSGLYALTDNGDTATQKWLYNPGTIRNSPAIANDGTIYVGVGSTLYAVTDNGSTFTVKNMPGGGAASGGVLIGADGTVYFGRYNGVFQAISANGTQMWTYRPSNGGLIYSTAAIGSDGTLYMAIDYYTSYGRLYAFKDLPVVDFTANTTNTDTAPLTVQFTDTSINPTSWAWDFNGDGIIDSSEQNPIWTYTNEGLYNVTLTVSNIAGNTTLTKTNFIKVGKPDLTINNLQTPTDPVNGTTYNVNATIANSGFNDAGEFVVKLYDNNVQIGKTVISGLIAGSNTTISFKWTPTTEGSHILSVIADVNKQINETNRNNNQITQTLNVISSTLPDLTVSNLELPINPVNGTTYTVNVTVSNTGTSDAGEFVVKLYDNNTQIGKINLTGLAAGAHTILNFNWTPNTVGNHILSVIADTNKQINETNRNNNQITQTLNVISSTLPDLTVSNLELPSNPVNGTSYYVTAYVTNNGNSAISSSFAVKLYDNNTQIQKITLNGLNVGETTIVTFTWTPTTNGTHNLSVIADANKQLAETIETNNQITKSVTAT